MRWIRKNYGSMHSILKKLITHEAMIYRGTINNIYIRPVELFKEAVVNAPETLLQRMQRKPARLRVAIQRMPLLMTTRKLSTYCFRPHPLSRVVIRFKQPFAATHGLCYYYADLAGLPGVRR